MKANKKYNAPTCEIIEMDTQEAFLLGSGEPEEGPNQTEQVEKRSSGIW